MNHKEFLDIFNNIDGKYYPCYELSLHGGAYEIVKFKNLQFEEIKTYNREYLIFRGEKKGKQYFYKIDTTNKNNIFEIIGGNPHFIKKKGLVPFVKKYRYREQPFYGDIYKDFNTLLLIDTIFPAFHPFIKKGFDMELTFYIKNGTLSPFNQNYPIKGITNSNGLDGWFENKKIIFNAKYKKNGEILNQYHQIIDPAEDIKNIVKKVEIFNHFLTIPQEKLSGVNNIALSPKAFSKIIKAIQLSFSSTEYFKNRSIFSKLLHKKIASHKLDIIDSPYHHLLGGKHFDDIGRAKKVLKLIDKGYLRGLTFNYQESKKFKNHETSHNIINYNISFPTYLIVQKGKLSSKQLLKNFTGLYIDDLIFSSIAKFDENIKFTPLNNLFYKNGTPHKKIVGVYFEQSLKDLFFKILAIGSNEEILGYLSTLIIIDKIDIKS